MLAAAGLVLDVEEFRVIIAEENPEEGVTHVLHLSETQHETFLFTAPVSFAKKIAYGVLFEEGYWNSGYLLRLQRKLPNGTWIDAE